MKGNAFKFKPFLSKLVLNLNTTLFNIFMIVFKHSGHKCLSKMSAHLILPVHSYWVS